MELLFISSELQTIKIPEEEQWKKSQFEIPWTDIYFKHPPLFYCAIHSPITFAGIQWKKVLNYLDYNVFRLI